MKSGDRDLLILLNESKYSRVEMEKEVTLINHLLGIVEASENRIRAIEVIDINRNRITCDRDVINEIFRTNILRPFQFIFHKN
ncbi:MAG TPA: hypothetical protein VNE41_00530 [Chitinophagaceae bacterium]|nr:hypothetical protein [Chitinophagaceae bacterium]